MKDKYCLNLVFNMNGNGDLSLNIGFDDSNKALEWQDHCERVKLANQTEEEPSQRSRRSSRRSIPKSKSPISSDKPRSGPLSFRQDFFNQAKEF